MAHQILFGALTVYAWALTMFVARESLDAKGSLLYVMTVAPAVLFIIMSLPAFLRVRWKRSAFVLLGLLVLAVIAALARADVATALSVGALCAMLIAIRHSRVSIDYRFANALFVLTVATAALMHAAGIGQYGILPGQSADDEVWWRVSMFPHNVTPSWLFALVVLGLNYFHGRGFSRVAFMLAAFYFLVLSASRTGLIIFALCLAFLSCTKLIQFRRRWTYRLFIPGAVALFVVALNAESVLALLVGIENPLVTAALFKSAEVSDAEQASSSIVRTLIWASHADLFMASPWVGYGSFDLQDAAPELAEFNTSGSESFLTGLFARIGLLALLFVAFIYFMASEAARRSDRLAYCLAIMVAISALAYGSYLVPYDFVFLMVFGAMNSVRHVRRRPAVLNPVRVVVDK